MIRADMISAVGRAYLTSNIENDEYSYPKAFSAASLTFAPIQNSAGRRFEKLDIRFVKDNISVLIETKQNFTAADEEQLSAYVEYEKALTGNKIIAILANTINDNVKVWRGVISDGDLMPKETALRTMDEYVDFYTSKINDKEKVMQNTYKLNEMLHRHSIPEKLRSQFVGTCLLALKNGLDYSTPSLTAAQIRTRIKEVLEDLLNSDINKAEKLALLNRNVLGDQYVRQLNIAAFREILKFIEDNILPFINDKSASGQDLLNLFFVTFNKYPDQLLPCGAVHAPKQESRSISENCTWGQRKRFADGKVTVPFNRFLGYDMGPDHNLVVNPEQAKLVKRIYGMFLQGQSPFQIARTLTEEGIPSPGGKDHWNPSNIKSILTNEKYKGDALLQKTFTVDFLTKKKKANEGEIPQYYVKDNHEAIIDPETFEMVQTLMATRKKGRNRKSSVSIFFSKVKCGDCGSWYGPKVWHSNDAYRKVIWQCNHKFDGEKCATPTLTEDEIKELFLRAANQVIDQKEQFIAIYDQVLSRSLDTTALESELSDLEAEINIAAELIEDCIKENAHVALDQAEYQKRYDGLVSRFDKANARHTEVTDLIAERMARKHQIESYLKELRSREPLTEFRETDWLAMVDYIAVHSKKDIWVTFKDGNEIKA